MRESVEVKIPESFASAMQEAAQHRQRYARTQDIKELDGTIRVATSVDVNIAGCGFIRRAGPARAGRC